MQLLDLDWNISMRRMLVAILMVGFIITNMWVIIFRVMTKHPLIIGLLSCIVGLDYGFWQFIYNPGYILVGFVGRGFT